MQISTQACVKTEGDMGAYVVHINGTQKAHYRCTWCVTDMNACLITTSLQGIKIISMTFEISAFWYCITVFNAKDARHGCFYNTKLNVLYIYIINYNYYNNNNLKDKVSNETRLKRFTRNGTKD